MIFFTAWILFFTIFNRIIEVEFGLDDYTLVESNIALFLQTYRNSIGDLAVPMYPRWELLVRSEDPNDQIVGNVMIFIVWFMWIVHQFIMLILLLNFLIAIVSQSYENVMQQSETMLYDQRIELNKETILTLEFFGKLRNFKALIVASLTDEARSEESEGDWKGLVTNMKDYFAKIMKN